MVIFDLTRSVKTNSGNENDESHCLVNSNGSNNGMQRSARIEFLIVSSVPFARPLMPDVIRSRTK